MPYFDILKLWRKNTKDANLPILYPRTTNSQNFYVRVKSYWSHTAFGKPQTPCTLQSYNTTNIIHTYQQSLHIVRLSRFLTSWVYVAHTYTHVHTRHTHTHTLTLWEAWSDVGLSASPCCAAMTVLVEPVTLSDPRLFLTLLRLLWLLLLWRLSSSCAQNGIGVIIRSRALCCGQKENYLLLQENTTTSLLT